MDGQSRIATRRTGDALNDTTPAIKYNVEDHLNSSGITSGGGGGQQASDGTGASDRKGVDIVHGVETKQDKYGRTMVKIGGDENFKPMDDVFNQMDFKTRDAVKNHWNLKPQEKDNIAVKDHTEVVAKNKEVVNDLEKSKSKDNTLLKANKGAATTTTLTTTNSNKPRPSKGESTVTKVGTLSNIALGTTGLVATAAEVSAKADIAKDAMKTGDIVSAVKKLDDLAPLSKFVNKLGIAGLALNTGIIVTKFATGEKIKPSELVDLGINVATSVISVSNPAIIGGLAIYGVIDAFGGFDAAKDVLNSWW